MQYKMKIFISTVSVGCLLLTSGCAPVAFMGAATGVATSAGDERGFKNVWSDTEVKTKIQLVWMKHKPELTHHLDVAVHQGQVLLTGVLAKPELQIEALRLVWTVPGVREIINETTVGQEGNFDVYAQDYWITTQLKSNLLMDDDIRSLNYNIQTVNGVVYLMGIAQHKKELNKVVEYARHMQGVKKVVSHVQFKGQMKDYKNLSQRPLQKKSSPQKKRKISSSLSSQESGSSITQEENLELDPPIVQDGAIKVQKLGAPNTGSSFQ